MDNKVLETLQRIEAEVIDEYGSMDNYAASILSKASLSEDPSQFYSEEGLRTIKKLCEGVELSPEEQTLASALVPEVSPQSDVETMCQRLR